MQFEGSSCTQVHIKTINPRQGSLFSFSPNSQEKTQATRILAIAFFMLSNLPSFHLLPSTLNSFLLLYLLTSRSQLDFYLSIHCFIYIYICNARIYPVFRGILLLLESKKRPRGNFPNPALSDETPFFLTYEFFYFFKKLFCDFRVNNIVNITEKSNSNIAKFTNLNRIIT